MGIVTRQSKGSKLTWAEMDGNLTYLEGLAYGTSGTSGTSGSGGSSGTSGSGGTSGSSGTSGYQYIDGWFNYANNGPTQSYTNINTPMTMSCDGFGFAGATSGIQDDYKPLGITRLFATSSSSFDFSELNLGDELFIRFNVSVTTTAVSQEFEFYLQCAIGWQYSYQLHDGVFQFKQAGTRDIGITIPIFIGNTQSQLNPCQLIFSSDGVSDVKTNSFYISTKRRQ